MVGRDSNGRFAKGNSFGRKSNGGGRKSREVEERYLEAIREAVSHEDLVTVFRSGLARAKAGDLGWAKLICDYLIGPPKQRVDVDVQGDNYLEICYVNDWRPNTTPIPTPGSEDG